MNPIISQIKLSGLNPKSEIARSIIINFSFLALLFGSYIMGFPSITYGYLTSSMIMFNLLYFSRYSKIAKRNQLDLENEFIEVFTYFGIYIGDGYNVYQSLNEIKVFCSERLTLLIDKLLTEIDSDKSVQPFINFSNVFSNVSIKEVLLSIYQMIDEGGGSQYIRQYEALFGKFSEERHQLELSKRKNLLESLTVLPLIGSGAIMVLLSISLVQIMGSYLSVI